jgi:hypothetical protein
VHYFCLSRDIKTGNGTMVGKNPMIIGNYFQSFVNKLKSYGKTIFVPLNFLLLHIKCISL